MTPEEIVDRYQATYGRLREATIARVAALWRLYGGLDDAAMGRFVATVVPIVEGGQAATGALVSAYMATFVRAAGDDPKVVPVGGMSVADLRGVPAKEVYRRPVVVARTAIAAGTPFLQALDFGGQRAQQLVSSDVAMAQRGAAIQVLKGDQRIVGYRRVITARSCSLCAAASTQRYRFEPMPIHPSCDCSVAPIYGTTDPGRVINQQLVDDLKAAAKQTGAADYWKNRHITVNEDGSINLPDWAVHDHGELGPTLAKAGHHFAGPGGIAA